MSAARARRAVRDIALCNSFSYFFTWTLNKDLIDRYDADNLKHILKHYLANLVRRRGFSYLLVPEHHKDGAIHMHGLCSGRLALSPAVKPDGTPVIWNDRPVYNFDDWKLGFSTCVVLDDDRPRVAAYIAKYITKGSSKIFGKWYYSSRDLKKRPDIQLLENTSFQDFTRNNPECCITPIYGDVCIGSIDIPLPVKEEII